MFLRVSWKQTIFLLLIIDTIFTKSNSFIHYETMTTKMALKIFVHWKHIKTELKIFTFHIQFFFICCSRPLTSHRNLFKLFCVTHFHYSIIFKIFSTAQDLQCHKFWKSSFDSIFYIYKQQPDNIAQHLREESLIRPQLWPYNLQPATA